MDVLCGTGFVSGSEDIPSLGFAVSRERGATSITSFLNSTEHSTHPAPRGVILSASCFRPVPSRLPSWQHQPITPLAWSKRLERKDMHARHLLKELLRAHCHQGLWRKA